jgi:hypothetical protein
MIREITASKKMKPCALCDTPHRDGEPAIEFTSGGFGKRLCVDCMRDIAEECDKKRRD